RPLRPAGFADRVAGEHGRAPLPVIGVVAALGRRPARSLVGLLMLALVHGTAGLAPFDEFGAARFKTGVPNGSGLPRIRFSGNSYLRPRVRSPAAAKPRGYGMKKRGHSRLTARAARQTDSTCSTGRR